jgi:hypothetical protein
MPLVFQYGSNTDAERLNTPERLDAAAEDRGRAQTVGEYEIAFNVWSHGNGCAVGNLMAAPGIGRHAWGVLFEVPADRILRKDARGGKKTIEQIEGPSYEPKPIRVRNEAGEEVEATTFLVKENVRRDGLWTSGKYVGHIVAGLRAHEVPDDYIQHVIDIALETNRRALGAAYDEGIKIGSLRNC